MITKKFIKKILITLFVLMVFHTLGLSQDIFGKQKIINYKYLVTDYIDKKPNTRYGYRIFYYYDKFPNQFEYGVKDEKKMSNTEMGKFDFTLSLIGGDEIVVDSTGLFVMRHLPRQIVSMDTSTFVPDGSALINSYDSVQFKGMFEYMYAGKVTPYPVCKFEYKLGWRHHFVEICPHLGIVKVTYYDKNMNLIRSEELVEINKEPVEKWISNHWTVPCFKPLLIRGKRLSQK